MKHLLQENKELKEKNSHEIMQLRTQLQKLLEQRLGNLNNAVIHATKIVKRLEQDNVSLKEKARTSQALVFPS